MMAMWVMKDFLVSHEARFLGRISRLGLYIGQHLMTGKIIGPSEPVVLLNGHAVKLPSKYLCLNS